jgi:hypothetical protein
MQEAARGALKAAMDIDIKGKTQAHTAHTRDTHTPLTLRFRLRRLIHAQRFSLSNYKL